MYRSWKHIRDEEHVIVPIRLGILQAKKKKSHQISGPKHHFV